MPTRTKLWMRASMEVECIGSRGGSAKVHAMCVDRQ